MGKMKWRASFRFEKGTPAAAHDISREKVVEIIDRAVETAMRVSDPENPFPGEALRHIARTAPQLDFGTWKCEASCGCPLAVWGVQLGGPDEGTISVPKSGSEFIRVYDAGMQRHIDRSAGIAVIQD